MTYEEKQRFLADSMKMLVTHPPFIEFMDKIVAMREDAIDRAAADRTFKTAYRTVAALGEVRAYQDMLQLYKEFLPDTDGSKV